MKTLAFVAKAEEYQPTSIGDAIVIAAIIAGCCFFLWLFFRD